MRFLSRRPDVSCREAVAFITAYLDGALPVRERRILEYHLSRCAHCAEYLRQLKATIEAAGHVDVEKLSPSTQQTLIELYRRTRQSND